MRLYSFVPAHYLSQLQCGLQTAHGVARLFKEHPKNKYLLSWADEHDTIIILNASNHAGVTESYTKFQPLAQKLGLPISIFHEDEQSMNEMATCASMIVPEKYYSAQEDFADLAANIYLGDQSTRICRDYTCTDQNGKVTSRYAVGTIQHDLISGLKSYRLA